MVSFGKLLANQRTNIDEGDTLFIYDGSWQRFSNLFGWRNLNYNVSADGQFVVVLQQQEPGLQYEHGRGEQLWGLFPGGAFPAQAVRTPAGYSWIADTQVGLVRSDNYQADHPGRSNECERLFRMNAAGGALYVATGAVAGNWTNQFLKDGVHSYVNGDWFTTDKSNDALYNTGINAFGGTVNPPMAVAVDPEDPDHVFLGFLGTMA